MKKIEVKKAGLGNMDFGMFALTIALLCIGLVMVASASSYHALYYYGDSNYLFIRQLVFGVIGTVAMIIISKIDYRKYKRWSYIGFAFAALLLLLVLTPLGRTANGAKRWLGFGILRFQPSEIMKPMLVLAIATYLSRNTKKIKDIKGYIVPLIMLLIVGLLMYFQKHMSGLLVLGVAALSVIFTSGIKLNFKTIIAIVLIVALAATAFITADKFRLQRIFSFMNPEQDILDGNWQPAQSLYAIGSGGLFGMGLGQSREKYLWLPEAQNDFIFSILAEELGFVGAVSVVLLFTLFIFRGYRIAMTCKDFYGSMIAAGITSIFALQFIINIAVVTCTIPVTGMPLPFFSYGGTSLFINLCSMGIVLNISKNCNKVADTREE
ncbi:MAG: putative lipid II flippase FtsW [Clostridia bacterium]|jgi:cell division protein FtsW|nr:putative lipid II flippase FtsW [Clostridia bacterium]